MQKVNTKMQYTGDPGATDDNDIIRKKYVDDQLIKEYTAGQNLSSGRVVCIVGSEVFLFDPTDDTYAGKALGITKTAALDGETIKVQIGGLFSLSGFSLTADQRYYAGINGIPVTSVAGLKVVQPIGVAVSTNDLAINFSSPIITN